jgi:molecular chaperone HscB
MFDSAKNHFDLFGLPQGFRIDMTELVNRYRELQKVVHPDRFAAADATSRRLSLQNATWVNEAFQTLRDPLRRAQYLLQLRGFGIEEQAGTLNDPEFLMRQMALREALESVRVAADPHARLDALLDEIDGLVRGQVAELATLLEGYAADDLAAAAAAVQRFQFLNKLQAEAEVVEAELEEAC